MPKTITPHQPARSNAGIGRFLLAAKAVKERDIPAQWDDGLAVCAKALDTWVKRECGDLHCIAPHFVLRPTIGEGGGYSGSSSSVTACSHVEVVWFEPNGQQWAIGDGLERLDAAVPRLGATVMEILDTQSRYVCPVFLPSNALEVASYLYWYGEADETAVLDEECGDDAAARSAMRHDMVTKQSFDDAFPAWALAWKPPQLSRSALAQAAEECDNPYVKEAASTALALARLRIDDRYWPEADGEFIGFGAVLSWREDDLTVRVYDDVVNTAHQSEFCDLTGEVNFALNDPHAFRAWQRRMRPRLAAVRLIDRLIWLLSKQY